MDYNKLQSLHEFNLSFWKLRVQDFVTSCWLSVGSIWLDLYSSCRDSAKRHASRPFFPFLYVKADLVDGPAAIDAYVTVIETLIDFVEDCEDKSCNS